jgi:hypothetical protein
MCVTTPKCNNLWKKRVINAILNSQSATGH